MILGFDLYLHTPYIGLQQLVCSTQYPYSQIGNTHQLRKVAFPVAIDMGIHLMFEKQYSY